MWNNYGISKDYCLRINTEYKWNKYGINTEYSKIWMRFLRMQVIQITDDRWTTLRHIVNAKKKVIRKQKSDKYCQGKEVPLDDVTKQLNTTRTKSTRSSRKHSKKKKRKRDGDSDDRRHKVRRTSNMSNPSQNRENANNAYQTLDENDPNTSEDDDVEYNVEYDGAMQEIRQTMQRRSYHHDISSLTDTESEQATSNSNNRSNHNHPPLQRTTIHDTDTDMEVAREEISIERARQRHRKVCSDYMENWLH
eukprot:8870_1